MNRIHTLLNQRTKKSDHSKMAAMAEKSASGTLTSFSGVFSISELSEKEKASLEDILKNYGNKKEDFQNDLTSLISITSEVKAIHNQAVLLHGERIQKAQKLLTPYRDGAFTAWLIAVYGNRQTPYNLLQYYQFYEAMPRDLQSRIESMPRQAIYVLASREGEEEKKRAMVENYKGENKTEMLQLIRQQFPLSLRDKRRRNWGLHLLRQLSQLHDTLKEQDLSLSKKQRDLAEFLLNQIKNLI